MQENIVSAIGKLWIKKCKGHKVDWKIRNSFLANQKSDQSSDKCEEEAVLNLRYVFTNLYPLPYG